MIKFSVENPENIYNKASRNKLSTVARWKSIYKKSISF